MRRQQSVDIHSNQILNLTEPSSEFLPAPTTLDEQVTSTILPPPRRRGGSRTNGDPQVQRPQQMKRQRTRGVGRRNQTQQPPPRPPTIEESNSNHHLHPTTTNTQRQQADRRNTAEIQTLRSAILELTEPSTEFTVPPPLEEDESQLRPPPRNAAALKRKAKSQELAPVSLRSRQDDKLAASLPSSGISGASEEKKPAARSRMSKSVGEAQVGGGKGQEPPPKQSPARRKTVEEEKKSAVGGSMKRSRSAESPSSNDLNGAKPVGSQRRTNSSSSSPTRQKMERRAVSIRESSTGPPTEERGRQRQGQPERRAQSSSAISEPRQPPCADNHSGASNHAPSTREQPSETSKPRAPRMTRQTTGSVAPGAVAIRGPGGNSTRSLGDSSMSSKATVESAHFLSRDESKKSVLDSSFGIDRERRGEETVASSSNDNPVEETTNRRRRQRGPASSALQEVEEGEISTNLEILDAEIKPALATERLERGSSSLRQHSVEEGGEAITTAYAVSNDELETEIRERIMREAVQATVHSTVEIIEETASADEVEEVKRAGSKSKRRCLIVIAFVVCFAAVVLGVVLGLVLPRQNHSGGTAQDVEAPLKSADEVREDIASIMAGLAALGLDTSSTPLPGSYQSKSLQFLLAEGPSFVAHRSMTDLFVLVNVFFATGGEWWKRSNGWLEPDVDFCDWLGVHCDENGTVTGLVLPGGNLTGSLQPELALLSNGLDTLDLSSNQLTGVVTVEGFGHLTSLTHLNLAENQFDWLHSRELWGASKLQYLNLSRNEFENGFIPQFLSGFRSLTSLDLSENYFQGRLAQDVSALSQLQYIDLHSNRFTGQIPEGLDSLTDLGFARFDATFMEGTMYPAVCDMFRRGNLEVLIADCDRIADCTCCTCGAEPAPEAAVGTSVDSPAVTLPPDPPLPSLDNPNVSPVTLPPDAPQLPPRARGTLPPLPGG